MSAWKSTIDPRTYGGIGIHFEDGRWLVLDDRGFWIAVTINKSVPSWQPSWQRAPTATA